MPPCFPARIRNQSAARRRNRLHIQPASAGGEMGKPIPAHIPYENGQPVHARRKESADVYFVTVRRMRRASPFQTAFPQNRLSIDVQPVFTVGSNTQDPWFGRLSRYKILRKAHPGILTILPAQPYPFCCLHAPPYKAFFVLFIMHFSLCTFYDHFLTFLTILYIFPFMPFRSRAPHKGLRKAQAKCYNTVYPIISGKNDHAPAQ